MTLRQSAAIVVLDLHIARIGRTVIRTRGDIDGKASHVHRCPQV